MLENLFWTIITIISVIIEWFVLKNILDGISKISSSKLTSYISFSTPIIIITILTMNNFNPNIKLLLCIIITYILYRLNYEVTILKSLFVSLLYWMVLIGFDAVTCSAVVMLNSIGNPNKVLDNNLFTLELIFLSKSLLLSLIPIIKSINLNLNIKKQDGIYMSIPVLANIISIIVIFKLIFKDRHINPVESIIIVIVSVVLLFSNFTLVSIIGRIIKDSKLRLENEIIKEKIDIQYKYYLNLEESQSKTRKLYHDMKNHIICIQNIYGDNEIGNQYIENLNNQLNDCNYGFKTNNLILDVILSEKKSICNNSNIDFFIDINFHECSFVDMLDVCSIFSNMLDNSIEACNKINDENIKKEIKLRGTVVNKFFIIKCENTKLNEIVFKNDKILTSKKNLFLHGIGISSIKNSVEKYSGNVEMDIEDNKFIMNIYIPLNKNAVQLEL